MSIVEPESLWEALESHLLRIDLAAETERWYQRVAGILAAWYGGDLPREAFTAETISRFLRDKQRAGLSDHYVKSLRGGVLALLAPWIDSRQVRRIRPARLEPRAWTPREVALLVAATCVLPRYKRAYYRRCIAVAFHTGVSKIDLHRIVAADFDAAGKLVMRRHRTGELVVARVPHALRAQFPASGPVCPKLWSDEQFRRDFQRIAKAANLVGSFKTLRKSSGTEAERLTGRGHEHLANSRPIFEAHYLDRSKVHREPVRLVLPTRPSRPPRDGRSA